MPVSETQKRARNKWDAANMAVISVKMRRDVAEQFAALAKVNGTTRNAVLTQAARDYIAEHTTEDDTTT